MEATMCVCERVFSEGVISFALVIKSTASEEQIANVRTICYGVVSENVFR